MFTGYQTLYSSPQIYTLSSILYPTTPIPQSRTKPLQVICLGLPRSGTESLSHALQKLSYSAVSHGIVHFWLQNANTARLWYELGMLRASKTLPPPSVLREQYFDRMLSDCEATTDIPSVWFAEEMLAAYPDVKVVLNRRRDTRAWKESFRASVLPLMESWGYWFWSWFQSELFWGMGISYFLHGRELFRGDFEGCAERAYDEHYERLEQILEGEGREFLRWSVEDGWAPLCEFLGKPVPDEPFPDGNRAAEFIPKLMQCDGARFAKAKRNALLFLSAVVATGGSIWWSLRSQ